MTFKLKTYKKERLLQGDTTIWTCLILLSVISVIEVYSASSSLTYKTGNYWQPMMEHGCFVFLGLMVTWLVHQIPCRLFKICSLGMLLLSFCLLIWAIFAGTKINETGRWIMIFGKTIQPSEFAKVALVGYTAYIMSICRDEKNRLTSLGIKMIVYVSIPFGALILKDNFSTAALLGLVLYIMLILGEASKKFLWLTFLCVSLLIGSIGVTLNSMSMDTAKSIAKKYETLHRLPTWVHRLQNGSTLPEEPQNYNVSDNQQVAHAKIAVATCNYIGKGPGKSIERDYLPHASSDFIYAIIIEEGGIESAVVVMILYLLLLYRSWKIASRCAKPFPAYLAMGLSLMLVLQSIINMGVAVGLLPVTGQPLPLISKGGTSYLITCIYIGAILSVSRSAKRIDEPSLQAVA